MTAGIVGKPKRTRPIDRVNYKLDSVVLRLLTNMASRTWSRTVGAQIEKLILQSEAIDRILSQGSELNCAAIEKEINAIWLELTRENKSN